MIENIFKINFFKIAAFLVILLNITVFFIGQESLKYPLIVLFSTMFTLFLCMIIKIFKLAFYLFRLYQFKSTDEYVAPSIFSPRLIPYQLLLLIPTVLPTIVIANIISSVQFTSEQTEGFARMLIFSSVIVWFFTIIVPVVENIIKKKEADNAL